MKTLTERIFAMNIIKTGREARQLINSGQVSVKDCGGLCTVVTNEDFLVSDNDEVIVDNVKPITSQTSQ